MIRNEQWGCLMWVNGLFARQKLFMSLTVEALLAPPPPWWWTQRTYTCSAPTQLPLGSPDLHAHGFPNWALNPGKEIWKKKRGRERKQNLIFMVNWEVTVGQYLRCIWIKALKHIQIRKKKQKKPQLPLPLFFFAVYIWQSKLWPGVCVSVYLKQTEHR